MTEAEQIAKFIAERGVTRVAQGVSGREEKPPAKRAFRGRTPLQKNTQMNQWAFPGRKRPR